MGVLLLVGTRKGMFMLRSDEDRRDWELEGPLLTGWSVFHAMQDPRDGNLYVAGNNFVYGGTVQRSSDLGKTWERSEGLGLPEETGLKLEEVWHVEPGHESQSDTLWLGATPGALFRSDDKGETWSPVMGLVQHETREQWVNQTLCRVNDCVVRLGVLQGEFHWHKHDHEDEFFYVVEGKFVIDLDGRAVELKPQQGFTVPKGVMHRTRAPVRSVILMIEGKGVVPTGD